MLENNALLDGFTVQGGKANDNNSGSVVQEDWGGGVFAYRAAVTIHNVIARYNQANQSGGGIYLRNDDKDDAHRRQLCGL